MTQRTVEEIVGKLKEKSTKDFVGRFNLQSKFQMPTVEEIDNWWLTEVRVTLETERRQARQEGYNAGLADGTGKPLLAIEVANERLREVLEKYDLKFGDEWQKCTCRDELDEIVNSILKKHSIDITPKTPQL
jgi:hypothetical protein